MIYETEQDAERFLASATVDIARILSEISRVKTQQPEAFTAEAPTLAVVVRELSIELKDEVDA